VRKLVVRRYPYRWPRRGGDRLGNPARLARPRLPRLV